MTAQQPVALVTGGSSTRVSPGQLAIANTGVACAGQTRSHARRVGLRAPGNTASPSPSK